MNLSTKFFLSKLRLPVILLFCLLQFFNFLVLATFINKLNFNISFLSNAQLTIKFLVILFVFILFFFETIILILVYSFFLKSAVLAPINKMIYTMRYAKLGMNNIIKSKINTNTAQEFILLESEFEQMLHKLNQANLELQDLREQNYQLDKMHILAGLSAGLAHEINNPLNNLSLNLEVLKKLAEAKISPDLRCNQDIFINNCFKEITRLKNIIENFASFSRISITEKQKININSFITEITEYLNYYFLKRNINFEFINKTKIIELNIHKEPLKFVIINLLRNAIEATPEKNGIIKILFIKLIDNKFAFVVVDNGAGISADNIKNIFKPFYTSKSNGTGIGLAISKRLTEICGLNLEYLESISEKKNIEKTNIDKITNIISDILSAENLGFNIGACFVVAGELA